MLKVCKQRESLFHKCSVTLLLWSRKPKDVCKLIDMDVDKCASQGSNEMSNKQRSQLLCALSQPKQSQPAVMRLVPPCCPPLTSCPNMSWVLVPVTSAVFSALSSHNSGACCVPSAHGQVLPLPFTSGMFLVIYCIMSWGKLFKPWKLLCLWQDLRMGHEQALNVFILYPNMLKGNKIRTNLLCYTLSTLEVFAFVYKGQWCRVFLWLLSALKNTYRNLW